jgi:hypothetical protein
MTGPAVRLHRSVCFRMSGERSCGEDGLTGGATQAGCSGALSFRPRPGTTPCRCDSGGGPSALTRRFHAACSLAATSNARGATPNFGGATANFGAATILFEAATLKERPNPPLPHLANLLSFSERFAKHCFISNLQS